jgi:hypothetical protein
MPKATVSTDTEKLDLKSVEGGWVSLRRMSYGEMLQRRGLAAQLGYGGPMNRQTRRQGPAEDSEMIVSMKWDESQYFDFSTCIVDHNLEDDGGRKLDFRNKRDFAILNPVVALEIEEAIDRLNNPASPEDDGKFPASGIQGAEESRHQAPGTGK